MPLIKEGKLRAIAVTGPGRFFMLPDTPAIADTVNGYAVTSWLGLAGPAGLPAPFVQKVNGEVRAILADPAVVERLRGLGSDARPTTPEGFRDARRRRRREMDQGGGRGEDPEGLRRGRPTTPLRAPGPAAH